MTSDRFMTDIVVKFYHNLDVDLNVFVAYTFVFRLNITSILRKCKIM